jgi:3,4-dihydroxy 2-butanone 4-phosphate synthase/GTP cyclohydrolase II
MGFDTVEANERLGFPADLRDYGMGAQMLNDLGVKKIRLITNNPRKIAGLKGYGLEVVDRVPLLIEANDYNAGYLTTKAEKMGHLLLQTYLITIALIWRPKISTVTERCEQLEKLRFLIRPSQLLLQEEVRPVAIALFDQSSLIFHLGLDQGNATSPHWYQESENPYLKAIIGILETLISWEDLEQLEFLISGGDDPMMGLQVILDRKKFTFTDKPSLICDNLQTQTIYSFHR